jgi:hypothetical protein
MQSRRNDYEAPAHRLNGIGGPVAARGSAGSRPDHGAGDCSGQATGAFGGVPFSLEAPTTLALGNIMTLNVNADRGAGAVFTLTYPGKTTPVVFQAQVSGLASTVAITPIKTPQALTLTGLIAATFQTLTDMNGNPVLSPL